MPEQVCEKLTRKSARSMTTDSVSTKQRTELSQVKSLWTVSLLKSNRNAQSTRNTKSDLINTKAMTKRPALDGIRDC